MRKLRILAIGLLASLTVFANGPVAAAGDGPAPTSIFERESVQAKLSPTGEVKRSRLYSQLTVEGDGTYTIANPTSTRGLRNLEGFSRPAISNDEAIWTIKVKGSESRRTVATYTRDLPVEIEVSYTLDGDPIEPAELVGRSGFLSVTYLIENVSAAPTEITYRDSMGNRVSETVELLIPLAGSLASTLDSRFTDVEAAGGVAAGDGKGNTRLSWSTVLFEPLGSPSQELSYTARVRNAVIPPAVLQTVPVNADQSPLSSGNAAYADAARATYELSTGAQAIDRNLIRLAKGAGDLLDGLGRLGDGATALSDGLQGAASGSRELADGTRQAADGGAELATGLAQLAAGSERLSAGLGQAHGGGGELGAGLVTLAGGADQLSTGMGQARSGARELTAGLRDSAAPGAHQVKMGLEGLVAGVGRTQDTAADRTAIGGLNAIAGGLSGPVVDGLGAVRAQQSNTEGCGFEDAGQVAACGMEQIGGMLAGTLGGLGDLLGGALGDQLEENLGSGLGGALEPALADNLRSTLQESLTKALNDNVAPALAASLKSGLEANLAQSLNADVRPPLTANVRQGIANELEPVLRAQLQAGLKGTVKPALVSQLQTGLLGGLSGAMAGFETQLSGAVQGLLEGNAVPNAPAQAAGFAAAFTPPVQAQLQATLQGGVDTFAAGLDPAFDAFAAGFAAQLAPAFATGFADAFDAQVGPSFDQFAAGFAAGFADGFAQQVGPSFAEFGQQFAAQLAPAFAAGLADGFSDQFAAGFIDAFAPAFGSGFGEQAFDPLAGLSGAVALKAQGSDDGLEQLQAAINEQIMPGITQVLAGMNNPNCNRANPTDTANPCGVKQVLELLAAGQGDLAVGLVDAADGAGRLTGGLGELDKGGKALAAGAGAAADGGNKLVSGLRELDDGGQELAAGARRAATGGGELGSGLRQLRNGSGLLATGLGEAAEGSLQLAIGSGWAKVGGGQIAEGAASLQERGTGQMAIGVNDAYAQQSRNLALVKALAERGRTDGMPAGVPEGGIGSAVYSFELAGADGSTRENATRLLLALGAFAGAGVLGFRRRGMLGS